MFGKKVLLIDGDKDFLLLISSIFNDEGAQVFTACDGIQGMSHVLTHQPDLIILDMMMPEQKGLQVCKLIRQVSSTPLIMLSTLDQDQLMLQGLEAGADDFLTKPVNPEVLLARAMAVMRRNGQGNDRQGIYDFDDGHLKININKQRVLIRNRMVKLTPVEFRLLVYLVSNPSKVLTFEQILFHVWGSEYLNSREYVHLYISNLRSKIEDDTRSPRYIHSVHGVGYFFESQKPAPSS